MLTSAMYWKTIHNRGFRLNNQIILLYGHLWEHLVQFITFQVEDTPLSGPYLHIQPEPMAHLPVYHVGR